MCEFLIWNSYYECRLEALLCTYWLSDCLCKHSVTPLRGVLCFTEEPFWTEIKYIVILNGNSILANRFPQSASAPLHTISRESVQFFLYILYRFNFWKSNFSCHEIHGDQESLPSKIFLKIFTTVCWFESIHSIFGDQHTFRPWCVWIFVYFWLISRNRLIQLFSFVDDPIVRITERHSDFQFCRALLKIYIINDISKFWIRSTSNRWTNDYNSTVSV